MRIRLFVCLICFVSCSVFGFDRLHHAIGQSLVVGFSGTSTHSADFDALEQMIMEGWIGGVILFGRNSQSPTQLAALTRALRLIQSPYPLIISVDQEGGSVQRLNAHNDFFHTPTAFFIRHQVSPTYSAEVYDRMAKLLSDYGFTLNYGPVVDLRIDDNSPAIGRLGRAYSVNPEVTTFYASSFVRAHRKHGILTVLKHFPGHGSAAFDSHKGLTDITSSWTREELVPYRYMIEDDLVDMVMVGHVMHRDVDADLPASLSPKFVSEMLRNDLKYRGIVITDDLQMGALSQYFPMKDRLKLANLAGVDLLLVGGPVSLAQVKTYHRWLRREAERNALALKALETSFSRIEAFKSRSM